MHGAFVSLAGEMLEDAIFTRVVIEQRLNDHSFCELTCRNTMDRPIPGADALGAECVITNTADDGSEHVSFRGVVVDVALKHEVWGSYSCVLRAASPSWLMDRSLRNAYFPGSLSSVAGAMGAQSLVPDKPSPAEYVQFGETDWRFLLRLADDHGAWIRTGVAGTEVRNSFDEVVPLIFRDHNGLLEFHIEGVLAPAKVAAAQYDRVAMQSSVLPGEAKAASFEQPGQALASAVQGGSSAQALLGFSSRSRSWTNADMQQRAQFDAERASGGAVTAGGISRNLALTAGASADVQNLGDANGLWHLLEVTHTWTQQEYSNTFLATPWQQWRNPQPPARGSAPGVQVARVISNVDPDARGRLVVSLFWQEATLLLAPMASLHCGAGFGWTMMPEAGDEVLVAFEDQDPERPVILGSLWNGVHQPPRDEFSQAGESDSNLVKRLVTKSGIRIHMVDTPGRQAISFATPRSNHLLLSEHVDETGRPAISMQTTGDIVLRAAGRIHKKSSFQSTHVDGQEKKGVAIKLTDWWGNTGPYQTATLQAELTSGESKQQPIASGQQFTGIPQGSNKFSFPDFYQDYKVTPEEENA